jgi:hypothetical protein
MARPDVAGIREALITARSMTAARDARHAHARPAKLRTPTDRRLLDGALAAGLAKAGVNVGLWEEELAKSRTGGRRRLEVLKADAVRRSGGYAKELRSGVEGRRKVLDMLAGAGPAAEYVSLDSPFTIEPTSGITLNNSIITPWNSLAKISFHDSNEGGAWLEDIGTDELTFWFNWENLTDGYALVNVHGFLLLNGFCTANSQGGFWDVDRSASLSLDANLNLLEWWNQPATTPLPQANQSQPALRLEADSSGWWADDDTEYALVFRGYDLSYELLAVPPGGTLLIGVALSISFDLNDAAVVVDFASGEFEVMCPFVYLNILPPLIIS